MSKTIVGGMDRRQLLEGPGPERRRDRRRLHAHAACGKASKVRPVAPAMCSKSVSSARRPGRWPASPARTTSSSSRCSSRSAKGSTPAARPAQIEIIVKDTQSSATRATEVTKELITSGPGGHRRRLRHAGHRQPGRRPVRGRRHAEHHHHRSVGGLVLRPQRSPGEGFKYSTMFFFGMQEIRRLLLPDVGPRWTSPSKTSPALYPDDTDANAFRKGSPRCTKRGLQGHRRRRLPERHHRLQLADCQVQGARRRAVHQRPDPAGLPDLLEAGRAAGLQAEAGHGRQGHAVPVGGRGARASSRTTSRPTSGGARPPGQVDVRRHHCQQLADDYAATPASSGPRPWARSTRCSRSPSQAFKTPPTRRTRTTSPTSSQKMKIECMSGALDFTEGPAAGHRDPAPGRRSVAQGNQVPWDITDCRQHREHRLFRSAATCSRRTPERTS